MAAAVSLLALAAGLQGATAEVYRFERQPVPPAGSLSTHYVFYVDAGNGPSGRALGPAVEFREVVAEFRDAVGAGAAQALPPSSPQPGAGGLQVALLPQWELASLLDPRRLCATYDDLEDGLAEEEGELVLRQPGEARELRRGLVHTVPLRGTPASAEPPRWFRFQETGAYVLTLSNCGNASDLVLTGSIAVRGRGGYLPATEQPKLALFSHLVVLYGALTVMWQGLLLCRRDAVSHTHVGGGLVACLAALEAACAWLFYWGWNDTGSPWRAVRLCAIQLSALKLAIAYLVVIDAGDPVKAAGGHLLIFVFVAVLCVANYVMAMRRSHDLAPSFLLLCSLVAAALHAAFFSRALQALTREMGRLVEQNMPDKLRIVRRTRIVMACALVAAALKESAQCAAFFHNTALSWRHDWLLADGASNALFAPTLVALMAVWVPQRGQSYAYGKVGAAGPGEVYDPDEATCPPKTIGAAMH